MKELVLCEKGIEAIRCAIVERAVNDFLALGSGELKSAPDCNIFELRAFFNGRLFASLCPESDPDWVLGELEKRVTVPLGAPPPEKSTVPRLYVPVPAWLGDALVRLREKNNLRGVDLEKMTGVSQGTISGIENGAQRTTAGICYTLVDFVSTWEEKKETYLALLPSDGKRRIRVRNYRRNVPVTQEERIEAAAQMKALREKHRITYYELAKMTGMCTATLIRIGKADDKITRAPLDAFNALLRRLERNPAILAGLPSAIDQGEMREDK